MVKDCFGPRRYRLACLILSITTVGFLLIAIGIATPAYTDAAASERIRLGQECVPGVPNASPDRRCSDEDWYRSMNNLRTSKWGLVDAGAGLVASGVTMLGFMLWNRKKAWRELSTPKSIWIVGLASAAWLLQIPAYDLLFMTELTRGYYPPWSDSVVIPMSQVQDILLWLFVPYLAIWLVFVVGSRLPAKVFSNASGRPLVNAFWTGVTALLFVPVALILIGAILDGPTMIVPLQWLVLWLLLCARSAALTRHKPARLAPT
ncbi:hypothetical protein ACSHT2_16020 [Bradyrhizobium sp. PUT101]|uniref:hypothetical protein n=1 Tax=unclassified Bradyrhizobium TaxID=2631580 RepID=UPI0029AE1D92|nr:hypothetical protein [Bradyrhizobium sp.]MDX3968818.1 hypothetical protein [Bradyrhizobium sp.]